MVNKYVGAGQAVIGLGKKVIQKLSGQGKTTGKEGITSVKPGKNLTKKRKHQDDVVKTRDKIIKEYGITDPKVKTDLRTRANQPKINKKIADIQDRARVKKMGGGMMGRRMGYSQGSNGSKKSSLGMQSVIHGLDKNPDVTKADPKAKFIAAANKKKKKSGNKNV
tara:strand:- start:24 stop:518 length:495 start_codon:yes stop_codon:yes gene_type:complete